MAQTIMEVRTITQLLKQPVMGIRILVVKNNPGTHIVEKRIITLNLFTTVYAMSGVV